MTGMLIYTHIYIYTYIYIHIYIYIYKGQQLFLRVNTMDMPPYLPNFSIEIHPSFGIQEFEEHSPRTCIWAEPQPFLDVSRNKEAEGSGKELPGLLGFFRLFWGIIRIFFGF